MFGGRLIISHIKLRFTVFITMTNYFFVSFRIGNQAVASLELMVKPNSELSEKSRVERAIKETISSGRAGALQVDPNYLELSAPETHKFAEEESDEEGLYPTLIGPRLWIVIGCVAALIVLAIAQAALTLFKTSGKTSSHKV